MDYVYQNVGTLCDEPNGLTCSFYVAREWGRAAYIMPYATFEAAADAVKEGVVSAFLVPCAYPRLSYFIMDEGLRAIETFIAPIPSLVLVGVDKKPPRLADCIFYHPATTALLPEVDIEFLDREQVNSNSMSCKALLADSRTAIGITNSLCSSFYGLSVYKVLRSGLKMPFICFARA